MIYRLPEIEDKDILNDYVQEHFALGENRYCIFVSMTTSLLAY